MKGKDFNLKLVSGIVTVNVITLFVAVLPTILEFFLLQYLQYLQYL